MLSCLVLTAGCWQGAPWPTLRLIGTIETCFTEKFATPRQGAVVPDALARLKLDTLEDGVDARAALDGLEAYSHVWLVWAAHLNGHAAARAKVQAPHLRGGRTGVFATRSPFRQNPLGLSLVQLRGIQGDTVLLSGVDLVSGTPVIDLKPYIPAYDAPAPGSTCRTAHWVDPPSLPVRFTPEATAALERLRPAASKSHTPGLLDAASLRSTLEQSLAADLRPLYRWRRDGGDGAEYSVRVDGVRVLATICDAAVTVQRLAMGDDEDCDTTTSV